MFTREGNMYCTNCGEENRNDRKFCANCGSPLKDYRKPVAKEDLVMPQDVIEENKKLNNAKKAFKIRYAVSLVLIIAACACVIISNFLIKNNRTVQIILCSAAIVLTIFYVVLVSINAKAAKKIKESEKE